MVVIIIRGTGGLPATATRVHKAGQVLRSLNQRPGCDAIYGGELVITNYRVPKEPKTAR